jgi:hypothetical protein
MLMGNVITAVRVIYGSRSEFTFMIYPGQSVVSNGVSSVSKDTEMGKDLKRNLVSGPILKPNLEILTFLALYKLY